ncbi:semaphorin-2A-like [Aphidius gifuensis]|uniref:semaphorin-2A-like n=1 Tax=Aphidius gifuensis TaxID=684658 RepID=UPI001CDD177C|nr:semaphorin-2A-like [Aphidius gifuensis]
MHSIEHPIFYLDNKNNSLFVGGRGRIFKLNLTDITSTNTHHDFNDTDIKIIQPFGMNRLFICGVKNYSSTNWIIHKNFKVRLNEGIKWKSPFSLKCSEAKTRKATALMDPNKISFYSGVPQYNKSDYHSPSIFRTNFKITNNSVLDPIDIQTSQNYQRIWPHGNDDYVGSFDVDDQVLFFFQESGNIDEKKKILTIDRKSTEEHRGESDIDPEERIYFRVARVCKNDNGSLNKPRTWTTYAKARLNCPSFETMNSIYKDNL